MNALSKLLSLIGLAALAAIAVAAYLMLAGRIEVAADGEQHPVTARVLETTRERAVARRAGRVEPLLAELDEQALLEAVAGYEDMCAACHTPPGGEPTALARGLNPQAPDLAESARHLYPEELFWVTRHGIRMTGMPAWGPTHSDEELWPLVALITGFPEFGDEDYTRLLEAAREAGVEHHHGHDDHHHHQHEEQDNDEEHDHDH